MSDPNSAVNRSGATTAGDDAGRVVDMLRDARITMITSISDGGKLLSRPMTIQQVDDDGGLWFFVSRSSDQAEALEHNPAVNVSTSKSGAWVSLAGTGEVVRDQRRIDEWWSDMVAAWFSGGPADPDVGLLHVRPDSAEYWDSPGGAATSLVAFVKAKATGKPIEGDNATTEMP